MCKPAFNCLYLLGYGSDTSHHLFVFFWLLVHLSSYAQFFSVHLTTQSEENGHRQKDVQNAAKKDKQAKAYEETILSSIIFKGFSPFLMCVLNISPHQEGDMEKTSGTKGSVSMATHAVTTATDVRNAGDKQPLIPTLFFLP